MVSFDEEKQNKKLTLLREQEEENLAKILSEKYGLQYMDLSVVSISSEALRLVRVEEAKEAEIAPFSLIGKNAKIGVRSPNNPKTKTAVARIEKLGYSVSLFMVSTKSLERVWTRYADLSHATQTKEGVLEVSDEEIQKELAGIKTLEDVASKIGETTSLKRVYKISRIVENILAGALALRASDIHIEPEEKNVRLRFRLDGVLTDVAHLDTETHNLLVSRIKLLSGLKLNVKEEAQDGRFSIKMGKNEIEIRSSILPGSYGEAIVMRVLNPDSINVSLEQLGMSEKLLEIVGKEIQKPNGMILNTGPTGSGKTTTLYAILRKVHKPEIKILTIEDPVEYHLEGIVQTQVETKKGYTFSSGLRAALRQDPDVIMVGEIRDGETADIAINASLTGHLVLSTLHTNSASGTFPRLTNLGANPKNLASAVNLAMAQRLVRKLCPHCKKEDVPNQEELHIIKKIVDSMENLSFRPTETGKIWRPGSCEKCGNLGYKGRVGIFEAILVNRALEQVINNYPSEREIKEATKDQGLPDLRQDAVIKILNGTTSFEEVTRVIDLEEGLE